VADLAHPEVVLKRVRGALVRAATRLAEPASR